MAKRKIQSQGSFKNRDAWPVLKHISDVIVYFRFDSPLRLLQVML